MKSHRPSAAVIAICSFATTLSAQNTVSVLTCSPSRLLPGETATCTVALSQAAGSGGTEVLLSSTTKSLVVSAASVIVPAGATSATFTVTAAAFSADETATLTATALNSVVLTWDPSQSPNLSHYNLYRGVVSGGPYPVVTAIGLVTAYTDSNVQAGQTYYYVVTAVDMSGSESAYSNEASATLPDAMPQTAAISLCAALGTGITVPRRCDALRPGPGRHGNYARSFAILRKQMMPLKSGFEVRPEFRKQVREPGSREAGGEMKCRRSSRAAGRRVIQVRKAGAHRGTRRICPIEGVTAVVGFGNQRAADSVAHPLPEPSVARPSPHVDCVLMKRGSHQEIAEEVLRGDVRG